LRWTTAGAPARLDEEAAEIVIAGTGGGEDLGVAVLAPASSSAEPSPGADPAAGRVASSQRRAVCAPAHPQHLARPPGARCVDRRLPCAPIASHGSPRPGRVGVRGV